MHSTQLLTPASALQWDEDLKSGNKNFTFIDRFIKLYHLIKKMSDQLIVQIIFRFMYIPRDPNYESLYHVCRNNLPLPCSPMFNEAEKKLTREGDQDDPVLQPGC